MNKHTEMKHRHIITFAMVVFSMLSLSSCVRQKLEQTYSKQEETIDKYIKNALTSSQEATVTYSNGSSRLTRKQGEGEELKPNGTVSFYYAGYVFSGNLSKDNLFCTNHQETASDAKWELTDEEYDILTVHLNESGFIEGLRNGLVGVKSGEECEILFSGKYGFGNKPFGTIPANSALLYKIWVESISND